jgi:molecular chaperone GrpE
MFLEEVEVDGTKKPRFELIAEGEDLDPEDKYKRALADYQNLLKQTAQEKQEFIKYAVSELLEEILPVYDHLKLSLRDLPETETGSAWVQGVKYVLKQFQDILASHGVTEIKTVGEKFDHNTMEALDGQGDKVIKEIMSGYTLNGRLLRAAKVIVG